MIKKMFGWRDLLMHSRLDVFDFAGMAKTLSPEIFKFKISLEEFKMRRCLRKSKSHEFGEVVVLFDHSPDGECNHTTTMYAKVYLGHTELSSVIKSLSTCDYTAFCADIQNAMFSYFCNLVGNDVRLESVFKGLSFPEKMISGEVEEDPFSWTSSISSMYKGHIVRNIDRPFVVANIRHESQMPVILRLKEN